MHRHRPRATPRRDQARRLQAQIESKNDPKGIRDRLLARRTSGQNARVLAFLVPIFKYW